MKNNTFQQGPPAADTLVKTFHKGWIIINKDGPENEYPFERTSIARNIIPPIIILLAVVAYVIYWFRNNKISDLFAAIGKSEFKENCQRLFGVLVTTALVWYSASTLYMWDRPILEFTPYAVCSELSLSENKKIYWDEVEIVQLRYFKRSFKLQFETRRGVELSINLDDIEASPYALAQVITKYKPFVVQDKHGMRWSLTCEYDRASRNRGLIYFLCSLVLFFPAIAFYLWKRKKRKRIQA